MTANRVAILGVFVADTTYRAERPPRMGETILGKSFALGPGGKGSNQAVAAARLGAEVSLITRLGEDAFAEMALRTWAEAGVTPAVTRTPDSYTGAAYIFVEDGTGDNAIIICPGAAATITPADLDAHAGLIADAAVFVTQLEQPLDAAVRGLEIARGNGVATVLNPAPGRELSDEVLALCDYLTPNETEAEALTGLTIGSLDDARAAAERLRRRGVGTVVMTLGEQGRAPPRPTAAPCWCRRLPPARWSRRPAPATPSTAASPPALARGMDGEPRRRLRLRRRRDFGDPPRRRRVDADAGRGRGAAGRDGYALRLNAARPR